MAVDIIAERIGALEAFAGLPDDTIARIARAADRIVFREGQAIVEAGAECDGATVIIGGSAHVQADPSRDVGAETLEAGTMIGEVAMLTEHATAVTVLAGGNVKAVKITRETMHALMLDDPELAQHFQSRLTSRLSRMILDLKLIDERLALACAMASGSETLTG
ncbi:MAG: cyclic nucleotide-binding domain-containing protein [Hyphomicrobiaceae bacterium]